MRWLFFDPMGFCVYILYSAKLDKFYVGMTKDLVERLKRHNNPTDPERFTARGIPWALFLTLPCESEEHSLRLERLLKAKKSKVFIQNLKKYPELI